MKRKTRTHNVIDINLLKLKQFLFTKYIIQLCEFIDPEDENEEEEINPIDVIN